jgi:hypothetical protein
MVVRLTPDTVRLGNEDHRELGQHWGQKTEIVRYCATISTNLTDRFAKEKSQPEGWLSFKTMI